VDAADGVGDARVRRPDWVAHVREDDLTVLLHLPSAKRTGLGPEGTAVWQAVLAAGADGVTAAEAAAAVAPRYDADAGVIEADVRRLLADLLAADLVERVDRGLREDATDDSGQAG
jgi:hypothetical protein